MPREESAQHRASHFICSLFHPAAGFRLVLWPFILHKQALAATHSSGIKMTAVLSLHGRGSLWVRKRKHINACLCAYEVWSGGRNAHFNRILKHKIKLCQFEYHALFNTSWFKLLFRLIYWEVSNVMQAKSPSGINGLFMGFRINIFWNDLKLIFEKNNSAMRLI